MRFASQRMRYYFTKDCAVSNYINNEKYHE